jgi:hypothetical protein
MSPQMNFFQMVISPSMLICDRPIEGPMHMSHYGQYQGVRLKCYGMPPSISELLLKTNLSQNTGTPDANSGELAPELASFLSATFVDKFDNFEIMPRIQSYQATK